MLGAADNAHQPPGLGSHLSYVSYVVGGVAPRPAGGRQAGAGRVCNAARGSGNVFIFFRCYDVGFLLLNVQSERSAYNEIKSGTHTFIVLN